MKLLGPFLLLAAAGVLGWIALRAPERAYVPPVPDEVQAHETVPDRLSGAVPEGAVVRTFAAKLHHALASVPGVVEAAVRFEDGTAEAVVAAETDPARLVAALSFDKYKARLR
jgi:hypothetical protein